MMELRLLRTAEEINAISPAWQNLLDTSECHRAFSSPIWFINSLKVFTELSPRVLVAEQAGRLMGVAPLVINNEQAVGRNKNKLCLLTELADYQDFIVAKGDIQTAAVLLQAVIDWRTEITGIELGGLRRNSNLCRSVDRIDAPPCDVIFPSDSSGLINSNDGAQICYYADLSNGHEVYTKKLNAKFRYSLRKAQRRAREQNVEVVELTPQQTSGVDVVDNFLRLHLLRFPDKLFSRPKPQEFCRLVLSQLFEQRVLRVFVLRKQMRVVGIHLSMSDVNGLGLWNGGFDPCVAGISPGKLLINKQIEVCCDEGLAGFDFLRGDEVYKKSWSTVRNLIGLFNISLVKPG